MRIKNIEESRINSYEYLGYKIGLYEYILAYILFNGKCFYWYWLSLILLALLIIYKLTKYKNKYIDNLLDIYPSILYNTISVRTIRNFIYVHAYDIIL